MALVFLPFTRYSPGGTKYGDGLRKADNCLPLYGGLYPLRTRTAQRYATMADGPVTGGHCHIWPVNAGGASYTGDAATRIVGTPTRLYVADAGAFTDVSRGALYAQTAGDNPPGWRFASFGNHVYAANLVDVVQKRVNNAGNFADMPGASVFKPECRFLAPVREFMLAAHINNLTDYADGFAWSDIDDPDWWDDDTGARDTSLAGTKRIVTRPGQVTGLVGGPYATLFKRNSIHAIQFTSEAKNPWRTDEVVNGVGCAYPGSLVDAPTGKYFFDGARFRRQVGLEYPAAISPPEIEQLLNDRHHFPDRAFIHQILNTMGREDGVMRGFYGDRTGAIYWTFANTTVDGANGLQSHDRGVVYNPALDAWGSISAPAALGLAFGMSMFPYADTRLDFALDRTELFTWEPAVPETTWCRFEGGNYAATIVTRRSPVAFSEKTGFAQRVKLSGVIPQFTIPDNGYSFTATPSMPAVPNVEITVVASNSLWHETQSDGVSTISPRSETYDRTNHADDYGVYPFALEGYSFEFQVAIPAGGEWIAIDGLWLDIEVVG